MNRDLDDDLPVLRQMFPAPTERDFPPGRRHQHEEHLMTSWLRLSRRSSKRRPLALRLATPLAVATAAAGAFIAFHLSTTTAADTPRAAVSHGTPSKPATRLLTNISTAAYTLDREAGDTVKITLHAGATRTANAVQLQKDLAAMGIKARVTRGRQHTSPPYTYNIVTRDKNGDFVATLSSKVLSMNPETVVFSLKAADVDDALTVTLDNGSR